MKKYLVEFCNGSRWVACGHRNARTAAGAIAQFMRRNSRLPDLIAVRATEVNS